MMPALSRWLNSELAILAHFKSSVDTKECYRNYSHWILLQPELIRLSLVSLFHCVFIESGVDQLHGHHPAPLFHPALQAPKLGVAAPLPHTPP